MKKQCDLVSNRIENCVFLRPLQTRANRERQRNLVPTVVVQPLNQDLGAKILGVNKFIPKLIKLDYSHFDKLAFSANLDIPDCDIKDDIKLAGELRQYDPGVGGQNAALRFFFEVREPVE